MSDFTLMDQVPATKAEAAAWYAEKFGWRIMPLFEIGPDGKCACGKDCTAPGKHPRIKNAEASADPELVAEWWHRKGWRDSNIGLWLEGSGLAVLDVDVGNGKDGGARLAEITKDAGLPETLVCRTPSGGMHAYYREREGLPNKSNALGAGLDIWRGKHYVILPPSNHRSGGTYTWEAAREPVEWPDVLMPVKRPVGRPRVHPPAPVEPFDASDPVEVKRLAYALTFIPSEDRDTWVRIGYVLAREFQWSEAGWQVFREWSAKATNYNEKQSHVIYYRDSKNEPPEGKPITVASLFEMARANPKWAPFDRTGGRIDFENIPDNANASLDALEALVRRVKLPVYRRGKSLIEIIEIESLTETDRQRLARLQIAAPPGTPIIQELTPGRFEDLASAFIRWVERRGGKLRSMPYGMARVQAYLKRPDKWGCPLFRAFQSHPTIRSLDDRSIITRPGLDADSGLYLTDAFPLDLPLSLVSKAQALKAADTILSPFARYRFFDENGKAIVLAAILTSLVRHCFRTVPGVAIEAARPGTGKTKAAQAMGVIALGRQLPTISYTANEEEMEKRLGAAKLMGMRDLILDNVRERMASAKIESMLTSESTGFRLLGESTIVDLVNDGMLYITGNGMTMSPDMRRRFLTLTIDAGGQVEAAARGEFDFDPPDLALKMRRQIIAAALAILKGFEDSNGKAKLDAELSTKRRRPVASFEDWGYIRDVVLWLGFPDLGNSLQENITADDDEVIYDKAHALAWMAKHGHGLTAGEIAERLEGVHATDEEIRLRGMLLRGRSARTARIGEALSPEVVAHGLKRLGLVNASWPAQIEGRKVRVAIAKLASGQYSVKVKSG